MGQRSSRKLGPTNASWAAGAGISPHSWSALPLFGRCQVQEEPAVAARAPGRDSARGPDAAARAQHQRPGARPPRTSDPGERNRERPAEHHRRHGAPSGALLRKRAAVLAQPAGGPRPGGRDETVCRPDRKGRSSPGSVRTLRRTVRRRVVSAGYGVPGSRRDSAAFANTQLPKSSRTPRRTPLDPGTRLGLSRIGRFDDGDAARRRVEVPAVESQ